MNFQRKAADTRGNSTGMISSTESRLRVRGVADAILEGRANAVQEVVEAARGGDDFVEVQEG